MADVVSDDDPHQSGIMIKPNYVVQLYQVRGRWRYSCCFCCFCCWLCCLYLSLSLLMTLLLATMVWLTSFVMAIVDSGGSLQRRHAAVNDHRESSSNAKDDVDDGGLCIRLPQ